MTKGSEDLQQHDADDDTAAAADDDADEGHQAVVWCAAFAHSETIGGQQSRIPTLRCLESFENQLTHQSNSFNVSR